MTVLFNPYTGKPRHPSDISSDPNGLLLVDDLSELKTHSPTHGMTIEQRILHVGGRTNAAGYVEFGSVQAVQALVNQFIRDLPKE